MASVVVKASLVSLILWVLSPLAMAAPPTVASLPADVDIIEDAGSVSISFAGVFDHTDILPGDILTLEVDDISHPAIASAIMAGTTLNITLAANANGSGTVTVEAEDTDGDDVTAVVTINVLPVNDQPVVVGSIPSVFTPEDVAATVSVAGVFDDVDIATNGDSIGLSVVGASITNPAIDSATIVGDLLSITVLPNQFGTGSVDVRATDGDGLFVEVSVSITVSAENDLPFVANAIPALSAMEDDAPLVVDVSNVFDDIDIATGDSLSVIATGVPGSTDVFDSFSLVGGNLTMVFAANQSGVGSIQLTATDTAGAPVATFATVSVGAVNDAPFVSGSIPNLALTEDDPTLNTAITAFDDVDIVTSADVISLSVTTNTNPGLFSDVSFSGTDMNITLAPDANGDAILTVIATDIAGATSAGVTFTVNALGVDDIPIAQPDSLIDAGVVGDWPEDGGDVTIPVLLNDDIGDPPAFIASVGDPGTHLVVNGVGDLEIISNGTVVISGSDIIFTPAENFWGTVAFEYTMQDANGDTDSAIVTIVVAEVNDAPEALDLQQYTTFENASLVVPALTGLLRGAYDIDPAQVDPAGDPLLSQPLSVVFLTLPPATDGTLTATASDGSFTFQPILNFVGVTSFTYAIFDNSVQSVSGTVQIEVFALPVPGAPPNAGEVAVTFNLSNTPLEQSSTVEPNVLVTMDDSGSMDWNFSMDMSDEQGRFPVTNSTIATSNVRSRVYSYLWDLATNTYATTSGCCGRILPSEASLPAGNDYQVWRARSVAFNAIYYNPEVTYVPWTGLDVADQDFTDADPEDIRLDPTSSSPENSFDITVNHSYPADAVPNWATNGGSGTVNVSGYYIPRYYEADGTLVEIRLPNQPFAGGVDREDCAIATACSFAEEIDNFANWFQYYRSRGHVAKAAIGAVVADLQDIRVGYETINENVNEPIAEMNELFREGEKEELLDAIYSVNNNGSTPLRAALDRSGEILGCTAAGRDCPALPAPEGICQQNYALLFSDGYWNQNATLIGNFDEDGTGVFDGGKYADARDSTLADVAMHYYESDLFPAVADGVPVSTADINGAPIGTFSGTNDTLHQHMKTYTIAFGVEGSLDIAATEALDPTGTIIWPDPTFLPAAKIDDLLHAAVNGRGRFLNAGDPQELQTSIETAFLEFTQAASSTSAAAFNSTSLRNGTLLYRGFYDLRNRTGELTATEVDINGVLAITPTWQAAERLDPSHAEGLLPSERVMVTYDATNNTGVAFQFSNLNANQLLTLNTAAKVDYLRGVRTSEEPLGNLRARIDLEGLLGDIVNSSPIFVGNPRGRNRDQAPYPISDLYSEFADDHTGRPAVVYVGANDGMLHGFNAVTGVEMMTFIPNKVIDGTSVYSNKLDNFTSTFYLHDYYVDLSPRLEDVYMRPTASAGKEWVTALVGGLGGGGKGYFALDVTDPATLFANETAAQNTVLWEFTDEDDTYPVDRDGNPIGGSVGAFTDPQGNPVRDLGFALAEPIIAMSNFSDTDTEQHWVAIFGNGPNSTAGIATLFILYMDEGNDGWASNDFVKLTTDFGVPLAGEEFAGFPNGLGKPAAVDIDLNGTVDYVYAGDRLGNLHRFDITDSNPSEWSSTRVFHASYTDGGTTMLQPILSQPTVVRHPTEGGLLITFGTGSFITEEDGENTDIQSIYTIWDELGDNPPTANADTKAQRLVEQTITNVVDDSGAFPVTRRILTSNPVDYESETGSPGTYGWYIDLDIVRAVDTISGAPNLDASGLSPPAAQFPGEKAIRRFLFRDGVLITTTVLPATNETACFGARPGAILVLDALTGGNPSEAIIDFNTDTYVDENDLLTVDGQTFSAGLLFDQSDLDGALVDLSTLGGSGDTDFLFVSGGNDTVSYRIRDVDDDKTGRLSWTQIIED